MRSMINVIELFDFKFFLHLFSVFGRLSQKSSQSLRISNGTIINLWVTEWGYSSLVVGYVPNFVILFKWVLRNS